MPYVIVIFCLDSVFRLFKKPRPSPRSRSHLWICLVVVLLVLLVTWIPSKLLKPTIQCLAQLASWASEYYGLAIMIFCGLLILSIAGAMVLCVQLRQTIKLAGEERLYSIQSLCYLALLIIFSVWPSNDSKLHVDSQKQLTFKSTVGYVSILYPCGYLQISHPKCYRRFYLAQLSGFDYPFDVLHPSGG